MRSRFRRSARPVFVVAAALLAATVSAGGGGGAPLPVRIENITVEATDPAGADASYHVKAYDPSNNTPLAVTCDIPAGTAGSGDFDAPVFHYPLGKTTVTCQGVLNGSTVSGSGNVTVRDTTAPTFPPLDNVLVGTSDPTGAVVNYTLPVATDAVSGSITATCTPAPGTKFKVGSTTVHCTAKDSSGNTGSASFQVIVSLVDDKPPTFTTVPGPITAEATGPSGATVTYTIAATDNVDPSPKINCDHASGTVFPLGQTTVTCTATDASGNTSAPVTFTVAVVDTTKPQLTVPGDMTVNTGTPSGTSVTYSASATDIVDGAISPSCDPPSGANFPVGTTTVNCSATDAHGNTANGSFHVTVVLVDTTPPVLTGVSDVSVEANGPTGSVVIFPTPTAVDDVDGPIAVVICSPASGTTFPLGVTTVVCSATDSHGNTGMASFTVRVVDSTPPHLIAPADLNVYATIDTGIPASDPTVSAWLAQANADDIADPNPTVTNDAPTFFAVGTTTITFTAHDASGNTASAAAKLTVLPKPPPGTPPPFTPPSDRTPPDDVSGLTATPGDARVTLAWKKPAAQDFDHVVITRTQVTGGSGQGVYQGSATTFIDRGLENGLQYRYVVAAVDHAGNSSAGTAVVAMPQRRMLVAPRDGARLRKPPKLVWLRDSDAQYYNVQLFRGNVKILSAWPNAASLRLHVKWKYAGHRYRLGRAVYHWYVWPGFGARSDANYGLMMGASTFQIVR
jgi:hypothetical protein